MGGSRDFLNHGVTMGGRVVAVSAVPEALDTSPTAGFSVVATLDSGIAMIPPFVLLLADIEGGSNPTADIQVFGFFADASQLLTRWQRVRSAVITDDVLTYVPVPTVGCSRLQVLVTSVEGAPTSVRLSFRAVSKEGIDLLHLIEEEWRPMNGGGGKVAISAGSTARIGPLKLDRAYHCFCTEIAFVARGDSSVVATVNDFPMGAGMTYEHTPRRALQQYLSFLAEVDLVLYWGQAT